MDDHAAAAYDGLREVIAGDRDLFTLEYPCHSPDQRRWFLMRATPLPADSEGDVVVAHVDITARKLAEEATREKQADLEHLLGRVQGLVGGVMEAVLLADSRRDVERTVCDRLVDVDPYSAAWVGRIDMRTESVVPAAAARRSDAGEDGAAWLPDGTGVPLDAADPVARALARRAPQVVADRTVEDVHDLHDAVPTNATSIAAFPLVYGETEYGVLVVYAADGSVVDERELAVLQVLSRAVSTAINAVEGRRILVDDSVTEVELVLDDEEPFFLDLSAELSCSLSYEGSLYGDRDGVAMLFVASGVDPVTLLAAARDRDDVEAARLVTAGDDRSVVEVTVDSAPLVDDAAERGAETTTLTAEDGTVTVTLELPASADTRALVEGLSERYPSISLVARRERERREQTKTEIVDEIETALTDRQRDALERAYLGGFFDWPRDVSGEDLAGSMDISPSTYHQHLRAAERKVLDALFGD